MIVEVGGRAAWVRWYRGLRLDLEEGVCGLHGFSFLVLVLVVLDNAMYLIWIC